MARTNIAAQSFLGSYPTLPMTAGSADLVFTAVDTVNGDSTALIDSKTTVLVYNSDVAARTVTFTSAPDTLNRAGDITAYSVGAGKVSAFGPFKTVGWAHTGVLYIDGSNALVGIAVITLP